MKEPETEAGMDGDSKPKMNTDLDIQKKEPEGDDSEGDGTDEEEDNYAEANDKFEEAQK